jgi:uncharacterized protein
MPGLAQLLASRTLWLLAALLVALSVGVDVVARLFWFEALGYDAVFWRILLLRAGLFAAAALATYAYLLSNLVALARRVEAAGAPPHGTAGGPWTPVDLPIPAALRARKRWALPAAALAPAVAAGLLAANGWDTLLRFLWAQPFGRVDPVYGRDLGFYVFSLPLLELAQNLVTGAALLAVLALAAAYRGAGLLGYRPGAGLQAPPPVRRHLAANLDLLLLAWAAGCLLDRYALLADRSGAVFGAGYTDVLVTRHALVGAAASIALFAALLHWSLATGRVRLLPALAGGFLAALLWFRLALGLPPWDWRVC